MENNQDNRLLNQILQRKYDRIEEDWKYLEEWLKIANIDEVTKETIKRIIVNVQEYSEILIMI